MIFVTIGCIKKKDHYLHTTIVITFMIYIGMVITVTLYPLPIQKEEIASLQKANFLQNVYVPLSDILHMLKYGGITTILRNIGGNVVLLMPLSILLPFVIKRHIGIMKMLAIGLLSSISIESTQAIISLIIGARYKISSIDDVILNTFGALIGYLFYALAKRITNNFKIVESTLACRLLNW